MKTRIVLAVIVLCIVFASGILVPYLTFKHLLLDTERNIGTLIASTIIIVTSLGVMVACITIIIPYFLKQTESREAKIVAESKRERLLIYKARQRAMLELLDEIASILREIRDLLKRAGGYEQERV